MINKNNRSVSANLNSRNQKSLHKSQKQHRQIYRAVTEHSQFNSSQNQLTQKQISFKLTKREGLKTKKEPQVMMEENMQLKRFVNELQDQLTIHKSKIQTEKKKTIQYSKQLSREFQKQLYYSGKNPNSHMIMGIKHQYEQIKQLYEEKCKQNLTLSKCSDLSQLEEIKIYCESLEAENQILLSKLNSYYEVQRNFDFSNFSLNKEEEDIKGVKGYRSRPSKGKRISGQISTEYLEENIYVNNSPALEKLKAAQYLLVEEQSNNKKAQALIERYGEKLKQYEKGIKDATKKIQFLEKVIIDKQNNQSHKRKEMQILLKEKKVFALRIDALEKDNQVLKENNRNQIANLRNAEFRKFEVEKQIFEEALVEQSIRTHKLEKEIRFLSTLLSYWKPIDELHRQYGNILEEGGEFLTISQHGDRSSARKSAQIHKIHENSQIKAEESRNHEESHRTIDVENNALFKNEVSNKNTIRSKSHNEIAQLHEPVNNEIKRSTNAKKCRKIQINDIKHLGELLRYRMIGYRLQIDEVKNYFNKDQPEQSQDYITMKELNSLFQKLPFALSLDQAFQVSRYIVEDSSSEFVFCDEKNEITRNIGKSIIKAFIGEYSLGRMQSIKDEWSSILNLYGHNMKLALKSIAPKGFISSGKLIELVSGLGIQMSENTREWMIGEMIKQSESLEGLNYEVLFNQPPP